MTVWANGRFPALVSTALTVGTSNRVPTSSLTIGVGFRGDLRAHQTTNRFLAPLGSM
jgi:hypothetical protein